MKKPILLVLALLMTLTLLAGCSAPGNEAPAADEAEQEQPSPVDSLKTIGDVVELTDGFCQSSVNEGKAIYAFEYDGSYYRVTADVSEDDQNAYFDLDFFDEDYEKKCMAILSPLPINRIECLDDKKLTDEEMAALVGKTGQDLLDAGWYNGSGYNLDTMEFWMNFDFFEYTVVFEGKIDESAREDFDSEEGIRTLIVKSVTFEQLGDATDPYTD